MPRIQTYCPGIAILKAYFRFCHLAKFKKIQPDIGQKIVAIMQRIEKQNPDFHNIFPVDYFSLHLSHCNFGTIIDLIDSLPIHTDSDILGNIYEYFLGKFALAEGRKSGQFYTPPCIVKLLVEMLEPFQGNVYDPCCGSGSMFVQSEKFTMAHQGSPDDITIFGQESNATTHRLCRMNLAIRGMDASHIHWNNEGSFLKDAHLHLKADYILANPPFNDSDWNGEKLQNDPRWQYGIPPGYNANFAWLQHIVSHLSPRGCAGVVLSNGSLSTQRPAESTIRKNMVEQGVIDCIVGLPDRLFYNTGISACLWFLKRRDKNKAGKNGILFIDARSLGHKQLGITGNGEGRWRWCRDGKFKGFVGHNAAEIDAQGAEALETFGHGRQYLRITLFVKPHHDGFVESAFFYFDARAIGADKLSGAAVQDHLFAVGRDKGFLCQFAFIAGFVDDGNF
jgi:type I restriction-modification system DNA methylase subunit